MARKVEVSIVDDMDQSADARTIRFALDGQNYEIDLAEANEQRLRDALAPFVDKATKVSARTVATRRAAGAGRSNTMQIREWAAANGHKVSSRGRIPFEVREAYDAAH